MPVRLRLKQSFLTSSFYCMLKRCPHGRDHVAGTWSRENNETWTQHMANPPPHLIWLYLPSWYTNNAGLCHISDMGTFSKQVQKYINGYISRKIPYCKTLRQVQDVLIRIPDDFTLHFDSDTGWFLPSFWFGSGTGSFKFKLKFVQLDNDCNIWARPTPFLMLNDLKGSDPNPNKKVQIRIRLRV